MTGSIPSVARPNRLLAALERRDHSRLTRFLEPVELAAGQVVNGPGKARPHVYFPCGAIISLLYETAEAETCEVAIVGNEGMAGLALVLGGGSRFVRSVVQVAGPAFRMEGQVILREFRAGGAVQQLLLCYMQALLVQIAQTAVCNRHHTVDQQLCRWLLMSLDRLSTSRLSMTQELMARMLGVRREAVTEAAGKLQRAGAINYKRGRIEVLDRTKLEAMACECYGMVRSEFARLLPLKGD
ncbi:MAG TPA: Crp/Fnr family transcriptional regulator [Rhodanobacteraceae bacterium]|nr:Crp/Fnr family transcriptional regulator [Rhodanobacteraceae bacterium]